MLDSRITQRRPSPPSTGGRDRPEWVVAIRRNGWSRSIGIAAKVKSRMPTRLHNGEGRVDGEVIDICTRSIRRGMGTARREGDP
jgi:hypothetical protein